jgi:hypothetical protein
MEGEMFRKFSGLFVVALTLLVVAVMAFAVGGVALAQGTGSPAAEQQPLTGEIVAAVLGAVLSIVLQVVPGLDVLWNDWKYKRATWLGGCLLIPLIIVGLVYAGAPLGIQLPGPFIWDGLITAIRAGLAAYFMSQVTYATVRPK